MSTTEQKGATETTCTQLTTITDKQQQKHATVLFSMHADNQRYSTAWFAKRASCTPAGSIDTQVRHHGLDRATAVRMPSAQRTPSLKKPRLLDAACFQRQAGLRGPHRQCMNCRTLPTAGQQLQSVSNTHRRARLGVRDAAQPY